MEESKEEWKGYIIVRDGKYWRVRNGSTYHKGAFTMLSKARAYVDAIIANKKTDEFNRALREIKKEPNLSKRAKEYKKLCQIQKSS